MNVPSLILSVFAVIVTGWLAGAYGVEEKMTGVAISMTTSFSIVSLMVWLYALG